MGIALPGIVVGVLGLLFGLMLGWFAKKFAVEVNPLAQRIEEILPGANCGACGYPGCSGLAEAIALGNAPVNACPVGGARVWLEISKLTGASVSEIKPQRALLLCQGGRGTAQEFAEYHGIEDCRAVAVLGLSPKACPFGCLGYGTCERVCPFGAIVIDKEEKLPIIDWQKCTGCGKCVRECPRNVLGLVSQEDQVVVACTSLQGAKEVRAVCKKGCIKCQLCVRTCPVGAISFKEGRIVIDHEKCTLCGACVEKCPTKCIVFVSRSKCVAFSDLKSIGEPTGVKG
ncbi:MAG: H+/Na+-translocating ferredoxin:NAD+ oxidoreductase subunit [Candidatus Atribacteria bacterium]|uniref:RnfABCDGE type electron transport complex subunit B n=1 Tax=Atrimonas thermophila TaxID=3064161 RepID=UPI0024AA6A3A|nr:H+/Na+-translocating ferredoxin:NAD+ oxidoreductase subunit [Candidatus Atribacteria bacterium]